MESVLEFLHNTGSAFIFCIALTLLFFTTSNLNRLLVEIKLNVNENNVLYEQSQPETDYIVEYKSVMGILSKDLDYDIEIDGMFISKLTHDYLLFDFSQIKRSNYTELYQYNMDGSVSAIIYKSD